MTSLPIKSGSLPFYTAHVAHGASSDQANEQGPLVIYNSARMHWGGQVKIQARAVGSPRWLTKMRFALRRSNAQLTTVVVIPKGDFGWRNFKMASSGSTIITEGTFYISGRGVGGCNHSTPYVPDHDHSFGWEGNIDYRNVRPNPGT